ncbi:DMT family transporter [Rhodophyticola sp. CCM32]|uniref:DMT family transporter n=1 Tax=Rhodophyticola sp. CCM32 TaxID=2916397 RepID=UPI00107FB009|nr:DMT family transporter [Rhodophyticola sp. CCM32]QBY01720.1 DMT family transporter [Rhodophyticola sp. CCM32]
MQSDTLRALPLILLAMTLIPIGDSAGKLLTAGHDTAPFFVAWSRFALGALLLAPFVLHLTPRRLFLDWRIWLRALLIALGITSILTALKTEPIANVFGAFFIGPILGYLLSAWLLREPITLARTLLLFIGFAGVLLVVKPGPGMTPGIGFAVLAGLFYGAYMTASRWLSGVARPRALLFSQLVIGALVLAPFGLTNLPPVTLPVAGLTGLSALGSMLGNLLLILALRMAPASTLAPFVYTQLLAATALGWLIFGDFPDALALTGLALLLISGFASLALPISRPQ